MESVTEGETEKADGQDAAAIKDMLLKLVNDDSEIGFSSMFLMLEGDYSLTDIKADTLLGYEEVTADCKKGESYYSKYSDNSELFIFTQNDKECQVAHMDGAAEVLSVSDVLGGSYSFFDGLGFDWSSFADGADDTEEPELTAGMLTVSEDLATCEFSQEYLKKIAVPLFETSMEDDAETLLKNLTATGVYNVAAHTVTFEFTSSSESLSAFSVKLVVTEENGKMASQLTTVEMTGNPDVTALTLHMEMGISNMKDDGERPTSATFTTSTQMEIPMDMMGVQMKSYTSENSVFTFDLTDTENAVIDFTSTVEQSVEAGGETQKSAGKVTLLLKGGKDGNYQMTSSSEMDGAEVNHIDCTCRLDGTAMPDLPDVVVSAAEEAIANA